MPYAATVLAELLLREPIFHRPQFPTVMAEGYWEIGASGQRYDRAFILRHLRENPPVDAAAANWQISDPAVLPLSADTYLVTYTLNQQPRLTQRSTLWRHTTEGWQVIFHQGTLISP